MGVECRLAHESPTLTLPRSTRGGEERGLPNVPRTQDRQRVFEQPQQKQRQENGPAINRPTVDVRKKERPMPIDPQRIGRPGPSLAEKISRIAPKHPACDKPRRRPPAQRRRQIGRRLAIAMAARARKEKNPPAEPSANIPSPCTTPAAAPPARAGWRSPHPAQTAIPSSCRRPG